MKLSPNQKRALEAVYISNASGYEGYLECGAFKPFHDATISSLIKKGLITAVHSYNNSLYHTAYLTVAGTEAIKSGALGKKYPGLEKING